MPHLPAALTTPPADPPPSTTLVHPLNQTYHYQPPTLTTIHPDQNSTSPTRPVPDPLTNVPPVSLTCPVLSPVLSPLPPRTTSEQRQNQPRLFHSTTPTRFDPFLTILGRFPLRSDFQPHSTPDPTPTQPPQTPSSSTSKVSQNQ